MLDILRQHLQETETPEFLAMIEEAHLLFEKFNLTDYHLEFAELLQSFDLIENPSESIYETTRNMQLTILQQHGITVSDDTSVTGIPILNRLLTIILLVEDTELVDEIESVYINVPDPKECLASIFNVLDPGIAIEDILLSIEYVLPSVNKRILEVVKNNRQQVIISQEDRITKEYQDFIRRAVEFIGMTHVFAMATMYDCVLQFKEYLPVVEEQLPDDPEKIVLVALSKELVMAAILSNAGNGNYLPIIKKYIDENMDLPIHIHSSLLVNVERLLTEVISFKTK